MTDPAQQKVSILWIPFSSSLMRDSVTKRDMRDKCHALSRMSRKGLERDRERDNTGFPPLKGGTQR